MKNSKATVTLFLDTRKEKKSGKYPIKLTIYYNKEKKRYNTNIDLSRDDWEKIHSKKLKDDKLKDTKIKLNAITNKAETLITTLPDFSFADFEKRFFNIKTEKKKYLLTEYFEQYILLLREDGRIGTAQSYRTTLNSLLAFERNINFTHITSRFLQTYENRMISTGKSPTTVGIYLRQLRAIFNQAIDDGIIKAESYPFKKYSIPSSRNIKKALSDDEIYRLVSHEPSVPAQRKALDFWLLSYLCNGINIIDILFLKNENLKEDFLWFYRAKTKNTKKKDLRPIQVPLHPKAKAIIEKYRDLNVDNDYLFPILSKGLSPVTIKNRAQKFVKFINSEMDIIRKELKIEQKVGTYAARHSFSTRLKRKGASTEFIKESLGHSSVLVTENYLDSFEDALKLQYSALLTD